MFLYIVSLCTEASDTQELLVLFGDIYKHPLTLVLVLQQSRECMKELKDRVK